MIYLSQYRLTKVILSVVFLILPVGLLASDLVNINIADSEELQTLNGIGPVTADNIVEYRLSEGDFEETEEIMNVSGIGQATFEDIKDFITVDSEDGDSSGDNGGSDSEGGSQSDLVNINTADSDDLQTLNGIGPVTAENIIDYRLEYGDFQEIEDIMEVSGIGEATFEDIKDFISVGDPGSPGGDSGGNNDGNGENGDSTDFPLDINQASAEELESLSGIGPAKAESIVEYRQSSGWFEEIEDIMNVSGIGQTIFENIKDNIEVSGDFSGGESGENQEQNENEEDEDENENLPEDYLPVNINQASAEELEYLDGIGPLTAEKIIEYREGHTFFFPEDIMNVSGIGELTFAKIEDDIFVGDVSLPDLEENSEESEQDTATTTDLKNESSSDYSALININTASTKELESLSGIGSALALAIVDHRRINGWFLFKEDIMEVSGIGEVTFADIKDSITLGEVMGLRAESLDSDAKGENQDSSPSLNHKNDSHSIDEVDGSYLSASSSSVTAIGVSAQSGSEAGSLAVWSTTLAGLITLAGVGATTKKENFYDKEDFKEVDKDSDEEDLVSQEAKEYTVTEVRDENRN